MIPDVDILSVKEQIASWPVQQLEASARQVIVGDLYSGRGSVGLKHV